MKLLQNLKKDKKGFTLVEMIVVIVIIGLLLAILVPGMFKYIDKAKDKQIMVNARTAYLNMSTAIAELYGKNGVTATMVQNGLKDQTFKEGSMTLSAKEGTDSIEMVVIETFPNKKSEVSGVELVIEAKTEASSGKFEITGMLYTEDKKSVKMVNGVWEEVVTKN